MNNINTDFNRKIEKLIKAGNKQNISLTMKTVWFPYPNGFYKVQTTIKEGFPKTNLYSKKLGKLVSEKWVDAIVCCTDYRPLNENTNILLIEYGDRINNMNMVDSQGKLVFKQWLNFIQETPSENIFIIGKGGRWNLYDKNKCLPLLDTWAYDIFGHHFMGNNLIGVEQEERKCNVLNLKTGSFLFEGFYRSIIIYSNAIELQKNNQTYNLADINGNILYNQWFDAMELKRNGDEIEWLKVKLKKKINYINSKGEYLLKKWADFGECFSDTVDGIVIIQYGDAAYHVNEEGVIYDNNLNRVELLSEGIVNNPQVKTYIANQLGIDVDDISGISKMDNYFNNMYHIVEYRDPTVEEYVCNFVNNRGDIIFKKAYFVEVYGWYTYYKVMFSDGKIDLINKDCKLVFPFKSNSIMKDKTKDGTQLISVENSDGQYGFFDMNDAHQLGEWYDDLYEFAGDRNVTPVKKNEKWNFLTKDGKYTFNNWFDDITPLSAGYRYEDITDHYCVHYHNRVNFFSPQGLPFINMWFDSLGPFYRGNILSVKFKNKYNLLKFDTDNNSGKLLLSTWYESIQPTNIDNKAKGSAMAYITEGNKKNLIDEEGNLLSKCDFDYISSFYHTNYDEQYCTVSIDNGANAKRNFIDIYGNLIFKKWFTNNEEFVLMNTKLVDTKLSKLNESKKVRNESVILNEANEKHKDKILQHFCNFLKTINAKVYNENDSDITFYHLEDDGLKGVQLSTFVTDSYIYSYFHNVIDGKGNLLFDNWYKSITDLSDYGMFIIETFDKRSNIYSLKDKSFFFKNPINNITWLFNDYFYLQNDDGKYNIINSKKEISSDVWFDKIFYSRDYENLSSIIRVSVNNKYNLVNLRKSIHVVFDRWYDAITIMLAPTSSGNNLFKLTYNGMTNFALLDGRILSNIWFDSIGIPEHGRGDYFYLKVTLKGRENMITQDGKLLFNKFYKKIGQMQNIGDKNYVCVKDVNDNDDIMVVDGDKSTSSGYNKLRFVFGGNNCYVIATKHETNRDLYRILDSDLNAVSSWVEDMETIKRILNERGVAC